MDESVPEIWIELGEKNKKKYLMCLFYREFSEWGQRTSTDSIQCQLQRFQHWTSKVVIQLEKNKELWLLGDFNFDLSRKNDSTYSRKNIAKLAHEEIIGCGMVQIIEGPTHRFLGKTSTIDLIFTNAPRKISRVGTISTGSEHVFVWREKLIML